MPRYFMRDTPLQAMEQLMMSQPGQKPRGGGIYRSPFHYTPKDVACEYCQNYIRKHPCRLCEYSTDVQVQLLEVDGGYDLYYLLPVEWMSDSNRAYPVVLDPVLQPVSNTYTIRDQSVFEKDQFSPFWGMVECGYNPRHYRERIFMKFKNLPKLTSADVIVSASVSMLKSGTDEPIVIEAHQVNGDWDSEDITWTNQPSHNSNVEDYQTVDQGEKWYTWDITHIAQTWYEDNKNTGVMFRMPAAQMHRRQVS